MANNLPVEVPAYVKALMASNADLQALIDEATAGISSGMPPTIVANGGRFVKKVEGTETVIAYPQTMPDGTPHPAAGAPLTVLPCIVLRARANIEKVYYASNYTPGQEPQSPDCFSLDGVRPDPSATMKMCESCAGCPQNVFGSGHDAQGNPSKGKACADRKVLAIFADNGVYRFTVPPASLQAWVAYCKQLANYGVAPQFVVTQIGFNSDKDKPFVLTFGFQGMLGEQQLAKILEMTNSPEVQEIIGGNKTPSLPAPPSTPLVENKQPEASAPAKVTPIKKEKAAAKEAPAPPPPVQETEPILDIGLENGQIAPPVTNPLAVSPEMATKETIPEEDVSAVIAQLGLD
jgi:hypothetical protein